MEDKEVTNQPFFEKMRELDYENTDIGYDNTHIVLPEEDATVGLSIDRHFVTLTKHYYGDDEVQSVMVSRELFEEIYKGYEVLKGSLGGKKKDEVL